jgi:CubicO group peptidase (beta-lactamase class C family)
MSFFLRAEDAPDATELESNLAKRLPADGPGIVVLVARDGKLLFSQSYGLADREKKITTTPETRFRIGSVTKQFTAAAILFLAQENRLTIEDSLTTYFPQYPGGDRIRLHHLLAHTSGLHNYTSHPDFIMRVSRPISKTALVSRFQNHPSDFPPGEQFHYSNANYVLLGQIVEMVSGISLGDYLQRHVFGPLNMRNTGVWINSNPPNHAAKGYSFINYLLQPAINWDMTWTGGAGELYSTTGDLWLWTEALHGGRILGSDVLRNMVTEVTVLKNETLARHGMGLYHSQVGWLPVIGHTGGLHGYRSFVMWFPNQKVSVVVLSNSMPSPPGMGSEDILYIAARAFLSSEMAARAPKVDPSVDPKTYVRYLGRYDYRPGVLEITEGNGHLFAQLPGQHKFEIFPYRANAFFFKDIDEGLVFNLDVTGDVVSVTHNRNGHTFTGLKISIQDSPFVSTPVLDAIVGRYRYGSVSVLSIARRGDQFYAQLTGQAEVPIYPKSAYEFYWTEIPASIEFIRNPDGMVTGAIHHQDGAKFTVRKLTT